MVIELGVPETQSIKPRITVFGIGGAGGNAVNNMIVNGLSGVEFVVANTDAQALEHSRADRRIQFGASVTQGLGAGSRPDIGKAAAEEALEQVCEHLNGSHMVFITAGMGGGTGTGAAPVVARAAREKGMLAVGFVTMPFDFEGRERLRVAEAGAEELQDEVDTLVIIPNQNLFRVANESTTFADAFQMADDVLHTGVRGITDLMVQPGIINLDFADVRRVMSERGKAMMGTGEAAGDKRALDAAEAAISNPLLDEVSMKGARGVLVNVTGGNDLKLFEVDEAARRITQEVGPDAHVIIGTAHDHSLDGVMRVSLVATGINMAEVLAGDLDTQHAEEAIAADPAAPRVESVPHVVQAADEAVMVADVEVDEPETPHEPFTAIAGGKSFAADVAPAQDHWPFTDREEVAVAGHHGMETPGMFPPPATESPAVQGFDDSAAGVAPQAGEFESVPVSPKPSFIKRVMTGNMRGSTQRSRSREPESASDSGKDSSQRTERTGSALLHDSLNNDENLSIPSFLRRRE